MQMLPGQGISEALFLRNPAHEKVAQEIKHVGVGDVASQNWPAVHIVIVPSQVHG